MRIAHINLAAGYRGGERQTQLLIEELAQAGWPQLLVARRAGALAARCRGIAGLAVREVAPNPLAAATSLGGADLVHVHQGRSAFVAFLHRLVRNTPYVITRRIQKGPRPGWLNRAIYRRASAIVALSGAIAQSVKRLDPAFDPVVIPDASSRLSVDRGVVAEIRRGYGGDCLVGHVGALDDSAKGQRQVIEVARRLVASDPGIVFVLVGSGRDEAALRREAATVSNLHFAGQVENVGDYLAAFDVFIYPSRHEGLGSVLLDAMASGLPVVATAVGGIPDVIDDPVNGTLCAVDDIDAMVAAIAGLRADPALRQRIAAANRDRAAAFSPAIMARRYVELYERIQRTT